MNDGTHGFTRSGMLLCTSCSHQVDEAQIATHPCVEPRLAQDLAVPLTLAVASSRGYIGCGVGYVFAHEGRIYAATARHVFGMRPLSDKTIAARQLAVGRLTDGSANKPAPRFTAHLPPINLNPHSDDASGDLAVWETSLAKGAAQPPRLWCGVPSPGQRVWAAGPSGPEPHACTVRSVFDGFIVANCGTSGLAHNWSGSPVYVYDVGAAYVLGHVSAAGACYLVINVVYSRKNVTFG